MPRRKTDAEVGVLGVWAYSTRDLLGLSSAQVAKAVGASDATIRKIEGGSNPKPSARLLRDIYRLFQETAAAQGIPIDPPPGLATDEASPGERDGPGDALIRALAEQTAALNEKLNRQADVIDRLAAAIEALVQAQPTPEDLIELVRSGLLGPVGGGGVGAGARQQ